MTKKLYDYDSYAIQFDAIVLSCQKDSGRYKTVLDRTLFFPEEGGQCCDKGNISGTEITYVKIENNTIYHYSDTPFEEGTRIRGEIDFETRFRNMQNHSGEHIICGIANKLFGCNNVGFHLGSDYVSMDLDCVLSGEDISRIELLANEAVFKNMPVTAYYPDEESLASLDYRAKGDIKENVRIVKIGDVDICACCAPHVRATGEIGLIKIVDAVHYKGGMRLNILCGYDALKDYNKRLINTREISSLISVRQDDVTDGVTKLLADMERMRMSLCEKARKSIKERIDSLPSTDRMLCLFIDEDDAGQLKFAANEAKEKTDSFAVVLSGNDNDGYRYIIISKNSDVGEITRRANDSLCGRGGGRDNMSSGTFKAPSVQIREFFEA